MIEILLVIVFNGIYILGFYNSCHYTKEEQTYTEKGSLFTKTIIHKNILWFLPYFIQEKLKVNSNSFFLKPLYSCMPCMASIHSYIYFLFFDFSIVYFAYVLSLSGFCLLLDLIVEEYS